MTSFRNILVNASLALGSLAFTCALLFGAGEIALQLKYGSVPPGPPEDWTVFDERRGWAMKPGRYSYFHIQAVRRVDVAINELGLRHGPLAPEPRAGVERVAIVGDSFVFGAPVSDGETITGRLQAIAGERYEVVNVAAPGYGTGQELRLLEALGAKGYQLGRKVVMAFFTNDIQDNLGLNYATGAPNPRQPSFRVDASGNLQQSTVSPAPPRAGGSPGLVERSLAIRFLRYQLEVVMVSHPGLLGLLERVGISPQLPRTPGVITAWHSPQWEERWQVTEDVLSYAVRSLRAGPNPPEVFIAFVPSPFQVHESFRRTVAAAAATDARYASFLSDPDRPQRTLQALAQRLDVRFIDLTPALREAAQQKVLYFPREGHFNEAGCEIVARVLHEQVMGNGSF